MSLLIISQLLESVTRARPSILEKDLISPSPVLAYPLFGHLCKWLIMQGRETTWAMRLFAMTSCWQNFMANSLKWVWQPLAFQDWFNSIKKNMKGRILVSTKVNSGFSELSRNFLSHNRLVFIPKTALSSARYSMSLGPYSSLIKFKKKTP